MLRSSLAWEWADSTVGRGTMVMRMSKPNGEKERMVPRKVVTFLWPQSHRRHLRKQQSYPRRKRSGVKRSMPLELPNEKLRR